MLIGLVGIEHSASNSRVRGSNPGGGFFPGSFKKKLLYVLTRVSHAAIPQFHSHSI